MAFTIAGLASQFDWQSLVEQLTEVERAPQRLLETEQIGIDSRNITYGALVTELGVLKNRVDALKDASLFNSRKSAVGDDTVASATAATSAAIGSYSFAFTQLAIAAKQVGATNVGAAISATSDVSGVVLNTAGFAGSVTAGTFTVNGQTITITTTDTLQSVFDQISSATGGTVTASYDPTEDKINLTSGGEILLGSAVDSSNFLQVARLYNTGTGTVASASALGSLKITSNLNVANFATTISDGGSGTGEFKINGVSISFNAGTDSLSTVLARINSSAAGVTASYDSTNDRITLTNKSTGDVGMALEDVTGNFLSATKLSSGALAHGKNLLYTVNGGGQLVSQSNTITEASSGITGLSVTALKEGASTTVAVTSDSDKIKTAIAEFITEYNKIQSLIDTDTASSTDAKGKVTAGILAGEREASDVGSQLRSLAFGQISGLSGTIKQLAALGYDTNGADNTIALTHSDTLDAALADHLTDVEALFTDATNGLAVQMSSYLDRTSGEEGTLVSHQSVLTKQSSAIDTQVADLERLVLIHRQQLIDSFVAMETARARSNQQLQFLQQRFGGAQS